MQITDKFRIGAQVYDRNLGQLGRWHPSLDWAFADYRFKPWFGIRGGKVKTAIGLYNDTQDLDFLHPFALLPQSIYPTDLRDSTIAHTGGDIYGSIPLGKRLGTLSYTGYAGQRQDSQYGGYPYLLKGPPALINFTSYGGLQYGGDLRWTTPLKGLLVGVSRMNEDIDGYGTTTAFGPLTPYHEWSKADWTNQYYGQYTRDKLQIDSEYRRYWRDQGIYSGVLGVQTDVRGWYVAGAYRVAKRLQLGSYYSRYSLYSPPAARSRPRSFRPHLRQGHHRAHRSEPVHERQESRATSWTVMASLGTIPTGSTTWTIRRALKPNTNALVVRTGLNF